MRIPLLVCVLVTACGPAPKEGLLFSPTRDVTFEVAETSLTYDSGDVLSAQRTIPIRVRRPVGLTGPLPTVIVMHGGGFSNAGHRSLTDWGEQLAAAGFITLHFANAEDEGLSHCTPLQIPQAECNADQFTREVAEGGTIPASMYSRPQDAIAILDRLAEIEAATGVQIDRDRLGALGHSAGAHAALSLAGMVLDLSPSVRNVAWGSDPRIKAFVANSPQGVGRMGIIESSWAQVRRPVLIQTGSGDRHEGETPLSRRDPFKALSGPNAFEHFIDDDAAMHSQFALEQDEGVRGHELALARTAIAFLEAFLNGNADARRWLTSNSLERATGGVSTLSSK